MSLTISQVAEVTKELAQSDDKITQAEEAIAQIELDKIALQEKNDTIKVFYDASNNSVNNYQTEHRWLDGTTYTPLPFSDIDQGARRQLGNIFFPAGWTNFAPFLDDKVNGLPQSSSGGHENEIVTRSLANSGIDALIDFLTNGQASGVSDDTLEAASPYSPGDAQIEVTNGGQTPGSLLAISGSGTSALVIATGITGTTIDITEIVPPASTIAAGGTVVEDIDAFTNNERNTLTSINFQNILDTLTGELESSIGEWETAINNQLTAITANEDEDRQSELTAAEADTNNAISVINAWQALPDTGSTGTDSKYTDNNLANISAETAARLAFISTRTTQIQQSLGAATQDSEGGIAGTGVYRERFERISLMINSTDGPLFQFYASDASRNASQQNIRNTKQKAKTFASGVITSVITENPTGDNNIVVKDASNFSIGDTIVIAAPGLDDLVVEITNVSSNTLELSKVVPQEYTVETNVSIAKAK